MRRADRVRPAGEWPETDAEGTVTLNFDARYRRRLRLVDDAGVPFLLDLERATLLGDGDALLLAEGGCLRVIAAAEPVAEVQTSDLRQLARLAWHLGNRHVAVQILADGSLRLRRDHVLEEMLEGLGARVVRCEAPFNPEAGAYTGHAHAEERERHADKPGGEHHHGDHEHHHPRLREDAGNG
jgi:urease accessory protein